MRIHDDSRSDPPANPQNHVRRLSPDTGEFGQFVNRFWNLAMMVGHQTFGHGDQVLGLRLVETGGMDDFFEFRWFGNSQGGGIRIAGEQAWSDHIHAFIRALGGEDGGDDQLKQVAVFECATAVWIKP